MKGNAAGSPGDAGVSSGARPGRRRLLVLAPHPFYQDRGTPIDIDLLLRVLQKRPDLTMDLLVYGEGEDRHYENLRTHRIPVNVLTRGVRPGLSWKKLLTDASYFVRAWRLVHQERFDLIHAGEEAAFMARFFKAVYGIPYIYDLDSSVAQQVVETYPWLRALGSLIDSLERRTIRGALAAAPVCNALADLCRKAGACHVVTLHDISQLDRPGRPSTGRLREETGAGGVLLLYAGNLEPYQGIDLLLEAFEQVARAADAVDLVLIGGTDADIRRYSAKAEGMGLGGRVHLLGPRPLEDLGAYLADADILTAPRIRGINTPMKIFPFLHSGRPVLVTNLPTNTQILSPDVAMLADPTPRAFAEAILDLVRDPDLRARLGRAGQAFVEANHTFPAHERRVNELYDWVMARLQP